MVRASVSKTEGPRFESEHSCHFSIAVRIRHLDHRVQGPRFFANTTIARNAFVNAICAVVKFAAAMHKDCAFQASSPKTFTAGL